MNVKGVGILFNRGKGIEKLENSLLKGFALPENGYYKISQELFCDELILKNMRRADDFSKLVAIAAIDAFKDAQLDETDKEDLGIIFATSFGPHPTTFKFLDDIISFGEKEASPTTFSHSVHNAAVSYVSNLIQNRGPTITITQFVESFYQALILAKSWLTEKRCKNILVGAADQYGEVMNYICNKKLKLAKDGKIKPFSFKKNPDVVPGEGAVFLLISSEEPVKYCKIEIGSDTKKDFVDLCIVDTDGMSGNEEFYLSLKEKYPLFASYTPIFGSMLTSMAFSLVTGILMLKNQKTYSVPVEENPHSIPLCDKTESKGINSIACIKYNCEGKQMKILLSKQ